MFVYPCEHSTLVPFIIQVHPSLFNYDVFIRVYSLCNLIFKYVGLGTSVNIVYGVDGIHSKPN